MSPEDMSFDDGRGGGQDDDQPRIHLDRKGVVQRVCGWKYFHFRDFWEAASYKTRAGLVVLVVAGLGMATWHYFGKSSDLTQELIQKEGVVQSVQSYGGIRGIQELARKAEKASGYVRRAAADSLEQKRLQEENKGLLERTAKIAKESNLEGQVALLQGQIDQILAETPYLQGRGFSYQRMDADGDGKVDGEEYASHARVLRFDRGNTASLERTLRQLRAEQGYVSQFEGSLSVLNSEEKGKILGEFTKDDVRVYFNSLDNNAGVENVRTGNTRSYRYAVIHEGGKR